jgi:Arc/MetJ-type ribon-helix-helix transcriptional regulator
VNPADWCFAFGTWHPGSSAHLSHFQKGVAISYILSYGECMARMISTTIRLNEEDVRALKRARAAGHSASELIRKGLRVVASRYYTRRRPPSTSLFESTDTKLGDESELFRNLEG